MRARVLRHIVLAAKAAVRDPRNRAVYGPGAPKVAELIWVDPLQVDRYIARRTRGPSIAKDNSGVVVDFAKAGIVASPLQTKSQVRSSFQHWIDGVPWHQTEDYQVLLHGIRVNGWAVGCRSEAELKERYDKLDEIFATVRDAGSFKTQKQLQPWNFREYGGVHISLDAEGRPILQRAGGYHRIAIAQILKLDRIPAMLGLVDIHALPILPRYRDVTRHSPCACPP